MWCKGSSIQIFASWNRVLTTSVNDAKGPFMTAENPFFSFLLNLTKMVPIQRISQITWPSPLKGHHNPTFQFISYVIIENPRNTTFLWKWFQTLLEKSVYDVFDYCTFLFSIKMHWKLILSHTAVPWHHIAFIFGLCKLVALSNLFIYLFIIESIVHCDRPWLFSMMLSSRSELRILFYCKSLTWESDFVVNILTMLKSSLVAILLFNKYSLFYENFWFLACIKGTSWIHRCSLSSSPPWWSTTTTIILMVVVV